MIDVLLRGILVGFGIAMPVGPIALLCIRRSLTEGRTVGFVSGVGAATADAFYGAVAAFGLTAISSLLLSGHRWISLVGGLLLCYIGMQIARAPQAHFSAKSEMPMSLLSAYVSTLLLTLTNPTTILSFVAIFAGVGLGDAGASYVKALVMVFGVFLGSSMWWLILSEMTHFARGLLSPKTLHAVNVAAGLVIAALGAMLIVRQILSV